MRLPLPAPELLASSGFKPFLDDFEAACRRGERVVVDTIGPDSADNTGSQGMDLSADIPKVFGALLSRWISWNLNHTVFITGGDTLLGCIDAAKARAVTPVRELFPGVPLNVLETDARPLQVVSKSGGFGAETLLIDLEKAL